MKKTFLIAAVADEKSVLDVDSFSQNTLDPA